MRPPITDDQFSALIEEHKGIIYKIANSYCRLAEDRKDLIQEIIVHLNRALMILYLDDNSYRDIAGILGITETNVATKINRLKLKIKEQFTQTNHD